MVYLKSNPSFPSLGQITLAPGFWFLVLISFSILQWSKLKHYTMALSYFQTRFQLYPLHTVSLCHFKGFPQGHLRGSQFPAPPLVPLVCWGCSGAQKLHENRVLLCSLHSRHWNERLAHRNRSVSIYWTNEFFSLPSFNRTDTIRQGRHITVIKYSETVVIPSIGPL